MFRTLFTTVLVLLMSMTGGSEADAGKKRGGKGTLVIVSTVDGATVSINGLEAGKTPLEPQRLKARTYRIKVEKLGHLAHEEKVRIRAGKKVKVLADLLPVSGVLSVDVGINQATVLVDGKVLGKAPLEVELELGKHTVTVRAPGMMDLVQTVHSIPGEVMKVSGPMRPAFEEDPLALAPLVSKSPVEVDDPLALVPLGSEEDEDPLALAPLGPSEKKPGPRAPDPIMLTREIPEVGAWYESWWAWGGAGAALVGTAVLTAVLLSGGETMVGPVADTAISLEPTCSWDDC